MSSIEYLVVVPNLATRHFGLSAFSLSQTNGVVVGAELPLLLGVPLAALLLILEVPLASLLLLYELPLAMV